jgi:hypothetical protein
MGLSKPKIEELKAKGFKVGDTQEFLGLSDEEMALIELKIVLARAIRERRKLEHKTQQQLADLMQSSQSRIAKLEAADETVSLDLLARAFFALGGTPKEFAGAILG